MQDIKRVYLKLKSIWSRFIALPAIFKILISSLLLILSNFSLTLLLQIASYNYEAVFAVIPQLGNDGYIENLKIAIISDGLFAFILAFSFYIFFCAVSFNFKPIKLFKNKKIKNRNKENDKRIVSFILMIVPLFVLVFLQYFLWQGFGNGVLSFIIYFFITLVLSDIAFRWPRLKTTTLPILLCLFSILIKALSLLNSNAYAAELRYLGVGGGQKIRLSLSLADSSKCVELNQDLVLLNSSNETLVYRKLNESTTNEIVKKYVCQIHRVKSDQNRMNFVRVLPSLNFKN